MVFGTYRARIKSGVRGGTGVCGSRRGKTRAAYAQAHRAVALDRDAEEHDASQSASPKGQRMDLKLEVVPIPVVDVDAAKVCYAEKVGFHLDHDIRPNERMRVVQMTPPGSACSVVIGEGLPLGEPGSSRASSSWSTTSTPSVRSSLAAAFRSAMCNSSGPRTLRARASASSRMRTETVGPYRS